MLTRSSSVCLVVGCQPVTRDDVQIQQAVKGKAEEIQSALVRGDLATVADLTHANVIEAMGGREKLLAAMARGLREMKACGMEFTSVTVLDPDRPIRVGKSIYLAAPFDLEMTAAGQTLRNRSAIIGASDDGGKTWSFIDAAPGRAVLQKMIPGLPDELFAPKNVQPAVVDR